jgi:predicted DCC family thiol-disulfide oxidoreductase YuxK
LVSPPKPVLVFDGECALCAAWVDGLRRREGQELECVAYQDAAVCSRFPLLAHERLEHSVHLIQADGRVHSGAQAVLHTPGGGWAQAALLWLYERSSAFARIAEAAYHCIAANRRRLSALFPRRRG